MTDPRHEVEALLHNYAPDIGSTDRTDLAERIVVILDRPAPPSEVERLRAFAEKVATSENDTAGTRAMARYALTGSLEGVVKEMRAALSESGQAKPC